MPLNALDNVLSPIYMFSNILFSSATRTSGSAKLSLESDLTNYVAPTCSMDINAENHTSRLLRLMVVFATTVLGTPQAFGTTYFVNRAIGNDSFSGQSAELGAEGDGPWRTLARIAQEPLLPGDIVYLQCGQTWNERLSVLRSGTHGAPITYESWPTQCAEKPLIDGSVLIPETEWRIGPNGNLAAKWPVSLVVNGSIAAESLKPWTSWSEDGTTNLSRALDCDIGRGACMQLSSGSVRAIAISNRFPLEYQSSISVELRAKIPLGESARVVVRRHGAPYDIVGLDRIIQGTGSWSLYRFGFTPPFAIDNARLDIELRQGNGPIQIDDVRLAQNLSNPIALYEDDVPTPPAHHPNGISTDQSNFSYLKIASDSPIEQTGNSVASSTLLFGDDLVVPAGESIVGANIKVRTRAWSLEEFVVSAIDNQKIFLSSPTRYPLQAGWGYFFTGKPWMVDSPGEWIYNGEDSEVILRKNATQSQGGRVTLSVLPMGIDAAGVSDVTIRNIAVTKVGLGASLTATTRVTLSEVEITHTNSYGVEFPKSQLVALENVNIRDTRLDALAGTRPGTVDAKYATIRDSDIEGSGVNSGSHSSNLPSPAVAAIHAGESAVIQNNTVRRTAYSGIRVDKDSLVSGNWISESCMALDDGGGIYAHETDSNSVVESNIIQDIVGNASGKPTTSTQAVGIYLDDWTSQMTIRGNTIVNADHGIQVHNAFSNSIHSNSIVGNRVTQLWMQEDRTRLDALGDIHSNDVADNLFVPLVPASAVYHISEFGKPVRFAQYRNNIYSGLLSPIIAKETWRNTDATWQTATYSLPQWQGAKSDGIPRNLDIGASIATQKTFAQYSVSGPDLIGTLVARSDQSGWRVWNPGVITATLTSDQCAGLPCLHFTSGTSDSLLSSPSFSVTEGQWYRLSFDLKSHNPNAAIRFLVRRGSAEYESLMGSASVATVGTDWRRYVFVFKATETAISDTSQLGAPGARLDFGFIAPGEQFDLGPVNLVPISSVDESTQIQTLLNPRSTNGYVDCPDATNDPEICATFVTMPDQTRVTWPMFLLRNASQVIFTQDRSLVDSDSDGIADSQDSCAGTSVGVGVNQHGCAR